MSKRIRYILFILLLHSTYSHSQELLENSKQTYQGHSQTVRGKVLDQLTQTSLPGATVVLLNSEPLLGSTSDADGKFRLENVPVGRRSIKVTYIGFKDFLMENIIVGSAKEVVLTIQLVENPVTIEEVEITGKKVTSDVNNEIISVSGRGFSMEESNRYAGSREDPSRMVSSYAGVSGSNDQRNDIIVRGNSPFNLLWRLDGVDIPNPNHFSIQGATGGPVSILNNNLLDQSDFITGAFPSEYGNKTGAVFDLKMRKGNDEKYEFTTQFGMNGIELMAEGPVSKTAKSSFLGSYRYSTLELFQLMGIDFGAPGLPRYQDFSGKLHIPTKKMGIFTLTTIGGASDITIFDKDRIKKDLLTDVDKGFDLVSGSKMGVIGLTNQHFYSPLTFGKITVAASGANFLTKVDSVWDDSLGNHHKNEDVYKNNSNESKTDVIYTLHHKINQRHFIKGGVNYSTLFYDLKENVNKYEISFDNKGNTGLLQTYMNWQWKLHLNITSNIGMNHKIFLLNKRSALEPRFGLKWDLTNKNGITLGYGVHNQIHNLAVYLFEINKFDSVKQVNEKILSNKNLDYIKAIHYVLGFHQQISKRWAFKTETYYQDISQVPIEKNPSPFSMVNGGDDYMGPPRIDSLVNKGTGKNYGVEFTLERVFTKDFYYLMTVSLFDSKYKGSDGKERNTKFNGNYVLNFLTGTEIKVGKKGKVLMLDVKYTFAGGKRYTPADLEKSNIESKAVYIDSLAFSKQYDHYEKLDFKIGFRENYNKVSITWYFSVENILNRENILQQIYNRNTKQIEDVYQLKIFPVGGFRMEF